MIESSEDGSETNSKKIFYWKWLIKNCNHNRLEYGTLDQAIVQEYVDLECLRRTQGEEGNQQIAIMRQETFVQSLVEATEENSLIDCIHEPVNASDRRAKSVDNLRQCDQEFGV